MNPPFTRLMPLLALKLLSAKRGLGLFVTLWVVVIGVSPDSSRAALASELAPVECLLQSTQLDFGTMARYAPLWVKGEGEVVVACQNHSPSARSATVSVGLLGRGLHSAVLRSGDDALVVDFFLDAQMTQTWGDGVQGGPSWQGLLHLAGGERRILRLPVHALLKNRRDAKVGQYRVHVPVQLTTLPR
jgi:spore coat protein U-like protein